LNKEIDHEIVVALKEVILEEKSINMVFEYAEHDILIRFFGVPIFLVTRLISESKVSKLGAKHYSKAIDCCAVGCVMAELASFRPIFTFVIIVF